MIRPLEQDIYMSNDNQDRLALPIGKPWRKKQIEFQPISDRVVFRRGGRLRKIR